MSKLSRRDFIKSSLAVASVPSTVWSKVRGTNNDVRVAVVGLGSSFGGQGKHHINVFHQLDGVRVVALCDADKDILNGEVAKFSSRNEKVAGYVDVRNLLEDKSIDAIVTATPNHWHSLLTIWACQAGKDIYVEKPISHNIWEGRKAVEASRKYKRIVQSGTQKRSDEGLQEAFEYIRQGNLGKILVARGFCYKRRKSIGKVDGPQALPESVDYDLWTGPARLVPLRRERLHYDWHWVWSTGNGDIGNQGIHEMDLCRWALGQNGLAPRAMSLGGRFGYEDDGETANTQIAILDYEPAPLIFEVRGLAQKKDDTVMDNYRGIRIGVVIECEGGYFAGGGGGGWAYDKEGTKIKQFKGDGGASHQANFIKAVRSRKVSDLNADILEGHISSALCHMGNISHRIGRLSLWDEIQEAIKAEAQAVERLERFREHLFANWVDLSRTRAVLGPWLEMDGEQEKFVVDKEFGLGRWANELLKRDYREPFVILDEV
ncbi:MAG: Gfo/Idh/MocA family oxidoreductase [Planctomycetota bacterium]|nr:MAG: Gfo/Idh/MocA family oxidoreductase [Planctomycetota bacterium]